MQSLNQDLLCVSLEFIALMWHLSAKALIKAQQLQLVAVESIGGAATIMLSSVQLATAIQRQLLFEMWQDSKEIR